MSSSNSVWQRVTTAAPCPACGRPDWCAFTPDGERLKCERTTEAPPGMVLISALDAGGMFKLGGVASKLDLIPPPASITRSPSLDWTKEAEACRVAITESQVSNLADNLGVTASALKHIGVGWASSDALQRMRAGGSGWKGDYPAGAFTFPERNHVGEVIGL